MWSVTLCRVWNSPWSKSVLVPNSSSRIYQLFIFEKVSWLLSTSSCWLETIKKKKTQHNTCWTWRGLGRLETLYAQCLAHRMCFSWNFLAARNRDWLIFMDCKDVINTLLGVKGQKTKYNGSIHTATEDAATKSLLSISQKTPLCSSLCNPPILLTLK